MDFSQRRHRLKCFNHTTNFLSNILYDDRVASFEQLQNVWLEPLKNWIKDAQTLNEIDKTTPVPLKKSSARTSF